MNQKNYCIIMAGGVGSRFWPMANVDCPKQFIDIMGTGESMLQSTFHRMERICPRENIIIVTGRADCERVRQQIPDLLSYQVLGEPIRRGTAPCIAYAAAVVGSLCEEANIIVTPSDHAIFNTDRYVEDMEQALAVIERHDWIVTMGVQPTNPNTKYGYIQFGEEAALPEQKNLHDVVTFTEKPPVEMARQFIMSGEFMWNTGILIWRYQVLKQAYQQYLPGVAQLFFGNAELGTAAVDGSTAAAELDRRYSICESISTDFGIMEKADNVYVVAAAFGWSDVETWDSLYETCGKDPNGNVMLTGNVFAYDVKNCVVHLPQDKTAVLQGLDGYIVAADDNLVMVCRRDQEERTVKFQSDVELRKLRSKS